MIILTGASGGIGRAILPALAALDEVVAIYNTNPPDVGETNGITFHKLDMTSESKVRAFVASLQGRLERITLIHAAALSKDGLVAQLGIEEWDRVMDVNLRGDFLLTRELLKPMIEQKWGRIIHFSSVAGIQGVPGTLAYSTAKTGLLGMSRVIANEHARFGITSNVLVLGYFNTGLIDTLSEKVRSKILASIPSGQLGEPQNIVNAIEFVMKSAYVNGSTIHIDGGI